MTLDSFVYPATVRAHVALNTKKAFFPYIGDLASKTLGFDAGEVAKALLERERLGSTGFGRGIALPHAKFNGLAGVRAIVLHLQKPMDFQSIDGLPVDLIFTLLSPTGDSAGADHLKALAGISRVLRDDRMTERLRGAKTDEALYTMVCAIEDFGAL